jgi:hypothetical protein
MPPPNTRAAHINRRYATASLARATIPGLERPGYLHLAAPRRVPKRPRGTGWYNFLLAGFFMRYVLDHWPEFVLMALFMVGGTGALFLPVSFWLRIVLIPVGWALGFAAWAGIVVVACWIYSVQNPATDNEP